MKHFLKVGNNCLRIFLSLLVLLGLQSTAWSSPVFSTKDNLPLSKPVEKTETETSIAKESVSPESTWSNPKGKYKVASVTITILSGFDLKGTKSNKTEFLVSEVTPGEVYDQNKIPVKVRYKNSSDKNKFAVPGVQIEERKNGTYKVTATIVEIKPGETVETKLSYKNQPAVQGLTNEDNKSGGNNERSDRDRKNPLPS